MKLPAALAISVSLLMAQSERAPLRTVSAVRHWAMDDVTRVAIELSGDFDFRSDRLHNPERIYFDILNAKPRIEDHRVFSENLRDKMLSRVRAAETTPGTTRVVLDLAGPEITANTSKLTNPYRLIIELRKGPPPAIPTEPPAVVPEVHAPPLPTPIASKPDTAVPEPELGKVEISKAAPPALTPAVPAPVPAAQTASAKAAPAAEEIGKAARHTSSGDNSLIRALGLKINRVVLDPGHGGHDTGTEGPKGLLEKDLVLDVAKRLGKLIEDRMGAEVIFTRTDDTFIPLEGRTALANEKKADLFLSIHANSSPVPRIAGVESYYLNFTDSKDALDVAARENASSQKSVFELQDVIQRITLHDKAEESKEFAGKIQTSLYGFSARSFPSEKNRGVKKAPFVVLIGAHMPSVLAEIGFLSNPREETLLKRPDYRQKLAEALFRGIEKYAEGLSHFQMAQGTDRPSAMR